MYTDSDDAGCTKTRKSTSCGALMHGSHLLKFYSSTQHVISLSSGESEFYAGVKAGSTLLGAMSMALDFGETKRGRLCFDATAAKAMLSRKGHGRAKRIDRSIVFMVATTSTESRTRVEQSWYTQEHCRSRYKAFGQVTGGDTFDRDEP